MPVIITVISRFLVAALLLAVSACSDNPAATNTSKTFSNNISCGIALTPYTADVPQSDAERVDKRIVRYQQAVLNTDTPLTYLEKLGWAYVAKARHSFDPGFYKLAERTAHCLASQQTNSLAAMLLQGHVLHQLHQFKEAETLAHELVARRGHWFDYGLLGDALMEQGKLDEAIDAYQRMMDQRPGPQAYSRAAHIRWLKGDLAGAIDMMQRVVHSATSRAPESIAWAQVRLGLYLLQAGDFPAAAASTAQALRLMPDYPPALLASGRILLAQGKHARAITLLTEAKQRNPLPEYQWALIEALRAAGQKEAAESIEAELIQHGAAEDPRTYALYLASVGKDADTALRLAQQELEVRADVFTLDTVAWALKSVGQLKKALAYSRRALAEGTQDARLFYHAGVIAAAAGDNKQATQWFSQAVAMEHMLLPSERSELAQAFAALESQTPTGDRPSSRGSGNQTVSGISY